MSEFVKKDVVYVVPIMDCELSICPSMDFMHHWQRNGAWMLKYWDVDVEPPRIANVLMNEAGAHALIRFCGLEVCERTFMGEQEHDHYIQFQEAQLDQLDFEVGDDNVDS
jgi:hypothetical protein